MIEQPASVHQRHEIEERLDSTRRWQRSLAGAVVIVALGLGVFGWIMFPVLTDHQPSLARTSAIESNVDQLDGKMKATDTKLSEASASQKELREQVSALGGDLRTRIASAGRQAAENTSALVSRVQAGLSNQIEAVQTRLKGLESSHENDRQQIAALQQELSRLRGEMASQTQELNGLRDRVVNGDADNKQQVDILRASVEEKERTVKRDVDALATKLAVDRVDFEATKNQVVELAPGVTLRVTKIDVPMHRVTGWMWVLPDRRTVWLRNEGVQDPVTFYGKDGKKRELVITSVTPTSVAGYYLQPPAGRS